MKSKSCKMPSKKMPEKMMKHEKKEVKLIDKLEKMHKGMKKGKKK